MADITPGRFNQPFLGSQFLSAVSESLIQTMGAQSNFLNYFQHSEKQFFINGPYSITGGSQTAVDGLVFVEFQIQIIDIWTYNITPGASGTTELDIKIAGTSGTSLGSWTSIFSTTPKITSAATGPTWMQVTNPQGGGPAYTPPVYTPPSGVTQGTLNTAVSGVIAPYTAIRLDLVSAMSGGQNAGAVIHYRPI